MGGRRPGRRGEDRAGARLAAAQGAGNGDVVETTPAGYRLHVRPGELDAERFEQLVEDGRQALAAGHAEQAAALLREALDAMAGHAARRPGASSRSRRPRSRGSRSSGWRRVEPRVEADLAAGRQRRRRSASCEQLVAEHPTRERLPRS